jgi:uncharacterized protein (TIGR00369 family)
VRFEVEGEEVVVRTSVPRHFEGYVGHVHGGVISALLDETIGWACCLAAGRLCYTVELKLRFRRPLPAATPITVRGRATGSASRMQLGEGSIEDSQGRLLASAEGSYYRLDQGQHDEVVGMLKMPNRPAEPDDVL